MLWYSGLCLFCQNLFVCVRAYVRAYKETFSISQSTQPCPLSTLYSVRCEIKKLSQLADPIKSGQCLAIIISPRYTYLPPLSTV